MINMTMSFDAYKNGDVEAYWSNNGTFSIIHKVDDDFDDSISILPSELKQILDNGKFQGKDELRPGLFPIKGQIYSTVDNNLITIVELQYITESEFIKYEITLKKEEWQNIFNACIKDRDTTFKNFGNKMIEPLVGKSSFTEESQIS